MGEPRGFATVSFSTEDLPEKDRVALWRDHYGRIALRVDIEPATEQPFTACVTSSIMPGLHVLLETLSAARITRTRELIADGNDDLALMINRQGAVTVSARGRQVSLSEGDAVLLSSDEVTIFERSSHGSSFSFRVPRSVLSSLVADIDDAIMRLIPHHSEALKLLTGYTQTLMDESVLATPMLRHLVVNHVHDLIALTLGTTRDAADPARGRGLAAARLNAAKAYIVTNSRNRALSIGAVADHLGVTRRHLQRLFELDGSTFSSFLLGQRLINAHRMLCDSRFADRTVSAIAYDVGFSDLSYFNRCFRRLYGVTPREIREAGLR